MHVYILTFYGLRVSNKTYRAQGLFPLPEAGYGVVVRTRKFFSIRILRRACCDAQRHTAGGHRPTVFRVRTKTPDSDSNCAQSLPGGTFHRSRKICWADAVRGRDKSAKTAERPI